MAMDRKPQKQKERCLDDSSEVGQGLRAPFSQKSQSQVEDTSERRNMSSLNQSSEDPNKFDQE